MAARSRTLRFLLTGLHEGLSVRPTAWLPAGEKSRRPPSARLGQPSSHAPRHSARVICAVESPEKALSHPPRLIDIRKLQTAAAGRTATRTPVTRTETTKGLTMAARRAGDPNFPDNLDIAPSSGFAAEHRRTRGRESVAADAQDAEKDDDDGTSLLSKRSLCYLLLVLLTPSLVLKPRPPSVSQLGKMLLDSGSLGGPGRPPTFCAVTARLHQTARARSSLTRHARCMMPALSGQGPPSSNSEPGRGSSRSQSLLHSLRPPALS